MLSPSVQKYQKSLQVKTNKLHAETVVARNNRHLLMKLYTLYKNTISVTFYMQWQKYPKRQFLHLATYP